MRIVVAVKPGAEQPWVADAAAGLAKQTAGTVAVISVDHVELERLAALPRDVYAAEADRTAEAAVRRLSGAGVQATKSVLSGAAVERILEFADEHGADLIVVGATTRGEVAERLLGSVPMSLVRRSARPVVVVTPPARAGSA